MNTRDLFLPMGSVTGIGSLPLADPHVAVQFVAEMSPEVPFWPQLPQRAEDEQMIEQVLGPSMDVLQRREGVYGYRVKPGRQSEFVGRLQHGLVPLDEQRASGFFAFERALEQGMFQRARAVKPSGQKRRLSSGSPSVLKRSKIGRSLVTKAKSLELLTLC